MTWIQFASEPMEGRKDEYYYSVSWEPRIDGATKGISAHSDGFPAILCQTLEALVNYTKSNKVESVEIDLLGTFPKAYVDRLETLFSLYSRAEKVDVKYRNIISEVTYQRP